MNCIWLFLIIVILINITGAKNLLEYRNITGDVLKASKPPIYITRKNGTIGIFPTLPNRGNQFTVNLKPPVKTFSQATQSGLYKNPLMRKLSIKYKNDTDNNKLKVEVTTRRPLMQTMKFTVKPHDVHAKSIRDKYNSNSNRRMINYKSIMLKSERNIPKTNSKTNKDESRFNNIKNVGMSLNHNNYNLSEKQNNKNRSVASGSLKPKTTILSAKRNNTKYFEVSPEKRVSKWLQINNINSGCRGPCIVIKNGINGLIMEFNNMDHKEKNFVVNLNLTIQNVRQTEQGIYRKPLMKKLLIKDTNNKGNVRATVEATTRRSLMQRKNFTVKPHNFYAKIINYKYNLDKNNSTYNLGKSKSEMNITKGKLQPGFEEKGSQSETQILNRDNTSINHHNFANLEKEHINNTVHTHDSVELKKSKRLLLFPKRNNLNDIKNNRLQLSSKNKTSSNTVDDKISNVTILKDKENITNTPGVIINSDSKDHLKEVKEPKENTSDQEKQETEGFINVKQVNQSVVSNAKHNVSGNGVKTIGQRFRFYRFMKNKM